MPAIPSCFDAIAAGTEPVAHAGANERTASSAAPPAGVHGGSHGASPELVALVRGSPWGKRMPQADLERVLASAQEKTFARNTSLVRASGEAQYWVGLVSGLVAQSVTHADGYTSFLSALGTGAWFGEGTLMKRGRWGYDIIALQETRAALIPLRTFEWLRETSLPFNHFIEDLMNARLSHYITVLLSSRHASTEGKVATALANLIDGPLYRADPYVHISQSELAMLAGTTRQRVNDVLKRLHALGLVERRRLGVEVRNLEALRLMARAN